VGVAVLGGFRDTYTDRRTWPERLGYWSWSQTLPSACYLQRI